MTESPYIAPAHGGQRCSDRETDLTNQLAFQRKVSDGLLATIRRLEDAIAQAHTPHAWAIEGCGLMWKGEYAEIDAQAEAQRYGGTCVAYPVFINAVVSGAEDIQSTES